MAARTFGQCLKLVSSKVLQIPMCDGALNFASKEAKGDIPFVFDDSPPQKCFSKKESATLEIGVSVFRLEKDATFLEMFGSLSRELEVLCLTQHQIRVFCIAHRSHLSPAAAFFLSKQGCDLCVAAVNDFDSFMYASFFKLKDREVWSKKSGHLVVVPQGHV